ncbi:hypothetical protein M409DRAFT_48528 [Zasmidium cellare ATCC 36951]|uniref:Uncharacterized protein n=1 Tax=Zasmidium cellare ATCC 36951 TaxID=1080233 RepID=A0A6A6D5C3_ZASCE|nr:uncharacterized protein M409DRAFT_48528 [Zasmidium cellare ATCC 36951]KAF2173570.1 hypothetical protein M409DRAFT_48528 [Zasmidium cellare ATCC 36951]
MPPVAYLNLTCLLPAQQLPLSQSHQHRQSCVMNHRDGYTDHGIRNEFVEPIITAKPGSALIMAGTHNETLKWICGGLVASLEPAHAFLRRPTKILSYELTNAARTVMLRSFAYPSSQRGQR